MSDKLKGICCIILAMISSYTYGLYTVTAMKGLAVIEPHRWVFTACFGIMWVVLAINYLTKSKHD